MLGFMGLGFSAQGGGFAFRVKGLGQRIGA